ncbi:hypothetical protein [Caballeronia arationis]|uniref:hypothetical protein n=1 Tax=Caballeronia arationis TaxID=1777142 RepID=UPI000A662FE1|nr:hypothetical protein [Caballeronia arationis]
MAELFRQTERIIKLNPFEQDVLQTVSKPADGSLKMARSDCTKSLKARLEGRRA